MLEDSGEELGCSCECGELYSREQHQRKIQEKGCKMGFTRSNMTESISYKSA